MNIEDKIQELLATKKSFADQIASIDQKLRVLEEITGTKIEDLTQSSNTSITKPNEFIRSAATNDRPVKYAQPAFRQEAIDTLNALKPDERNVKRYTKMVGKKQANIQEEFIGNAQDKTAYYDKKDSPVI